MTPLLPCTLLIAYKTVGIFGSMLLDKLQLFCLLHIVCPCQFAPECIWFGEQLMLDSDSYHGNGIMMSTVFVNAQAQLQPKICRQMLVHAMFYFAGCGAKV